MKYIIDIDNLIKNIPVENITGLTYKMGLNIYGIIYSYHNLHENKYYVGQTINPESRLRSFKNLSEKYAGDNINDVRQLYSPCLSNNWTYNILGVVERSLDAKEKLDNLEKYYINYYDSYKNGYNMTIGGSGIHIDISNEFSPLPSGFYNNFQEAKHDFRLLGNFKNGIFDSKIISLIEVDGSKVKNDYRPNLGQYLFISQDSINGQFTIEGYTTLEKASLVKGCSESAVKSWVEKRQRGFIPLSDLGNLMRGMVSEWILNYK